VAELTAQLDAAKAECGDTDEKYPDVVALRQQTAPPS